MVCTFKPREVVYQYGGSRMFTCGNCRGGNYSFLVKDESHCSVRRKKKEYINIYIA
jgi:hypothetical protein